MHVNSLLKKSKRHWDAGPFHRWMRRDGQTDEPMMWVSEYVRFRLEVGYRGASASKKWLCIQFIMDKQSIWNLAIWVCGKYVKQYAYKMHELYSLGKHWIKERRSRETGEAFTGLVSVCKRYTTKTGEGGWGGRWGCEKGNLIGTFTNFLGSLVGPSVRVCVRNSVRTFVRLTHDNHLEAPLVSSVLDM